MVSFVWSSSYPFLAGTGGSENYTAGQVRELTRRNIPARVITLGYGEKDGREGFLDINFKSIESMDELSELNDTLVFVTYPLNVRTKHQSFVILHCPPISSGGRDPLFDKNGVKGKVLIANSRFSSKLWSKELGFKAMRFPVVYPFAEKVFAQVARPKNKTGKLRILFAGRLTPDKGVYTLLAALHMPEIRELDFDLTVTTAGNHSPDGIIIEKLLRAHPNINIVPSQQTSADMAIMLANHDIVAMPSSNIFWQELFGALSVEAQHAGCRVVASRSGGLPETNCGGLLLVAPDNPKQLAIGIAKAAQLGPLTAMERQFATTKFGVAESVDKLLKIIKNPGSISTKYSLPKYSGLVWEQLDFTFQGITQLGLGLTGKQKLSQRHR